MNAFEKRAILKCATTGKPFTERLQVDLPEFRKQLQQELRLRSKGKSAVTLVNVNTSQAEAIIKKDGRRVSEVNQ